MGIFLIVFYILLWLTWPRETIIFTTIGLILVAISYGLVFGVLIWGLQFIVDLIGFLIIMLIMMPIFIKMNKWTEKIKTRRKEKC